MTQRAPHPSPLLQWGHLTPQQDLAPPLPPTSQQDPCPAAARSGSYLLQFGYPQLHTLLSTAAPSPLRVLLDSNSNC
jgi:hypothetical protein